MIRRSIPLRRSRPRRQRKGSLATLRRKLWALLAKRVKEQHGDKCFTCVAGPLSGSNLHAGHFVNAGLSAATRYDPDNIRPQCMRCNVWLHGNVARFGLRLQAEIGEPAVRALVERSEYVARWRRPELAALCEALEVGWRTYCLEYPEQLSRALVVESVHLLRPR